MVGSRIAPDNNDVVVWKLDESAAPFINSSTSTNAISHAVSDLATLSGSPLLQQPSLFAASGANSCVLFTGNNSGSPRNFISGANSFNPQPPFTISGWMYLRAYNSTGFTIHPFTKQHTTNVWSGITFTSIAIQNRTYASQSQQWDFFVRTDASNNGGNALVSSEFTIPLGAWTHIGLTYDATTVQAFINGNLVSTGTASPTGNVNYGTGPWFFGAIPGGSGNPEEVGSSICDVRIADVVRPQSYFTNIYKSGIMNAEGQISVITKFYKMRAFDLYYTKQALYWTGTAVSYEGAPASPSGWGLGPIEVLETYSVLNV